jgi:uncharacterized protein YndB with AHSA1/START domain
MTTQDRLGKVERDGGRTTIRFTRSLAHPPEKVWQALTESEHMRYWMPGDLVGLKEKGATLQMVFWHDLVEAKGIEPDGGTATVEVWDPPRTFEWIWNSTRIRFEINPTSGGSTLQLTVGIGTDDPDLVIDAAGGFHLWLEHLANLLDTGSSIPLAAANPEPIEARYRAQVE